MGEEIQIQMSSSCSSNYQIYQDIDAFLNKQHHHIQISLLNKQNSEKEDTKEEDMSVIRLQINSKNNNKKKTIDMIKGTKLYYLYLRNGECARWV